MLLLEHEGRGHKTVNRLGNTQRRPAESLDDDACPGERIVSRDTALGLHESTS